MTAKTRKHLVIGQDPCASSDDPRWFIMRDIDCESVLLCRRAMSRSTSWSEFFFSLLPEDRQLLIHNLTDWEREDLWGEPFDPQLIPCVAEGDWPPMPGVLITEAPAWMPPELLQLAHQDRTALHGDILSFSSEVLLQVRDRLEQHGFICRFDDDEIREAWGFPPHPEASPEREALAGGSAQAL